MGTYLNPGSDRFLEAVSLDIYVDKTSMISYLNSIVRTSHKYLSVSRPRRFGKTMAVDMLCAYYGRGTDARKLFESLAISKTAPISRRIGPDLAWDAYLGAFDVVRITMTEFMEFDMDIPQTIARLTDDITRELMSAYPQVSFEGQTRLINVMQRIYATTGTPFVVVVDEWDAPMRERPNDEEGQRAYLDFLRDWLKDQPYVALAYITGILPVKKYGRHSALNMFDEYSMVAPLQLAAYVGFTDDEVRALCDAYDMSFEEISHWYDGYRMAQDIPVAERVRYRSGEYQRRIIPTYSPLSVVMAMRTGTIQNWWNKTETYEALAEYIRMDFDGLKESVAILMDGGRAKVDLRTYQNDLSSFSCRDDVLSMLIHIGYLGWDEERAEAFVPNREVLDEFRASTKDRAWDLAFREYELSKELVEATWNADATRVAELLEVAHDRVDNRGYNSEAALSYAVQLAYYAAQRYYTTVLELDSGKGYADIAYLPAPGKDDKPALLIELKWNRDANTALSQIRDRRYYGRLSHYEGNLLLVGIGYNKDARPGTEGYKHHTCEIMTA